MYNKGYIVEISSELVGMAKGMDQQRDIQNMIKMCMGRQKAHVAIMIIA